jgi:hypothetical protein
MRCWFREVGTEQWYFGQLGQDGRQLYFEWVESKVGPYSVVYRIWEWTMLVNAKSLWFTGFERVNDKQFRPREVEVRFVKPKTSAPPPVPGVRAKE